MEKRNLTFHSQVVQLTGASNHRYTACCPPASQFDTVLVAKISYNAG